MLTWSTLLRGKIFWKYQIQIIQSTKLFLKKSHQVWTLSLQHNILTCLFFYSSVRKEALALDNPVFKFPILSETNNCNSVFCFFLRKLSLISFNYFPSKTPVIFLIHSFVHLFYLSIGPMHLNVWLRSNCFALSSKYHLFMKINQ